MKRAMCTTTTNSLGNPRGCLPSCLLRRESQAGRRFDVCCTIFFWLLFVPYLIYLIVVAMDLYSAATCFPDCVRIERLDLGELCSSEASVAGLAPSHHTVSFILYLRLRYLV